MRGVWARGRVAAVAGLMVLGCGPLDREGGASTSSALSYSPADDTQGGGTQGSSGAPSDESSGGADSHVPAGCWTSVFGAAWGITDLWTDGVRILAAAYTEILVFDGERWTEHHVPQLVTRVDAVSIDHAWFLGEELLHWDGASLSPVPLPPDVIEVRAMAEDHGQLWIAGSRECVGCFGSEVLYRWAGGDWIAHDTPAEPYQILDLDAVDGVLWAATFWGLARRRVNSGWELLDAAGPVFEVVAISADEAWGPSGSYIVGSVGETAYVVSTPGFASGGFVRDRAGTLWATVRDAAGGGLVRLDPVASILEHVVHTEVAEAMVGMDDGSFVVGGASFGHLLQRIDVGKQSVSEEWSRTHFGANVQLTAAGDTLTGVDSASVQILDPAGPESWTRIRAESASGPGLTGVWSAEPGEGWVTASFPGAPPLWRLENGEMRPWDLDLANVRLLAIWGSADDLVAGGALDGPEGPVPAIARWDGQRWTASAAPVAGETIRALSGPYAGQLHALTDKRAWWLTGDSAQGLPQFGPNQDPLALRAHDSSNVWVLVETPVLGGRPLQWNGSVWSNPPHAPLDLPETDWIKMGGTADDMWLASGSGENALAHYDGESWGFVPRPETLGRPTAMHVGAGRVVLDDGTRIWTFAACGGS